MGTAIGIASAIIAKAMALPTTLLGWDGSAEAEIVLENLKNYIHRCCGWEVLSVEFDGKSITVWEPNHLLFAYSVSTGRVTYGRAHHMGLRPHMLAELDLLA